MSLDARTLERRRVAARRERRRCQVRLALRKLRGARVPATFFLVGKEIDAHANLPAVERKVGPLGDHTYTHPQLTALDPATMQSEIARTQARIATAAGARPRLFRPPYPELLAADPPTAAQLAAGPSGCGASAGQGSEGSSGA